MRLIALFINTSVFRFQAVQNMKLAALTTKRSISNIQHITKQTEKKKNKMSVVSGQMIHNVLLMENTKWACDVMTNAPSKYGSNEKKKKPWKHTDGPDVKINRTKGRRATWTQLATPRKSVSRNKFKPPQFFYFTLVKMKRSIYPSGEKNPAIIWPPFVVHFASCVCVERVAVAAMRVHKRLCKQSRRDNWLTT